MIINKLDKRGNNFRTKSANLHQPQKEASNIEIYSKILMLEASGTI